MRWFLCRKECIRERVSHIVKTPLYEQIYHYIVQEILQGRLKNGSRVPSENELAEQFNVSRITSKKALEKLEQVRLIKRTQGKGSFVSQELPDLTQITSDLNQKTHNPIKQIVIGVLVPDFSDSYGGRLLQAIEERASELSYHLMMKLSYGRREEEEQAIHSMVQFGVNGLIMLPVHGEYYNAEILKLILGGFPVVLVDRYLKGIPAVAVYTDNRKAAEEITNYLLDRGHKHIAFLSPPVENTSAIEERLKGFTTGLSKHNINLTSECCLTQLTSTLPKSFGNIESDAELVRSFIEKHPEITAFVSAEYNIALILHQVIVDMGKTVPQDYAIVCFDSPATPFDRPFFTHIQQDETIMGHTAVDLLARQLNGESTPIHEAIDFRIVQGRS